MLMVMIVSFQWLVYSSSFQWLNIYLTILICSNDMTFWLDSLLLVLSGTDCNDMTRSRCPLKNHHFSLSFPSQSSPSSPSSSYASVAAFITMKIWHCLLNFKMSTFVPSKHVWVTCVNIAKEMPKQSTIFDSLQNRGQVNKQHSFPLWISVDF